MTDSDHMSLSDELRERAWADEPADDDTVWRYMDFSKYVSLLTSEELWFSRVDQFDDPYEGMPTEKDLDQLAGDDSRERQYIIDIFEDKAEKVFANCWYNDTGQSDAMWKLYPNSEQGVAVRSEVGDVKSALQSGYDIAFANVHYIDWEENRIPPNSVFAPSLHKREAFEHEKEMRILLRHDSYDDLGEHPYGRAITPPGVDVCVDLEDLIGEVFTSPKASDWFHEAVTEITNEYTSKSVQRSNLYEPPS